MVFTVVKPVMSIFQVSPEQGNNISQSGMGMQSLSENALVLPQQAQGQAQLDQNHLEMHSTQPHVQPQMQATAQHQGEEIPQHQEVSANTNSESNAEMPFAEVSSLLDPNMKGSKARKYLISYDEIKRRLQAPEKMSLRSLAAYTRVSRGPASKKTLLESLNVLGLMPSTTTAVSSSFSKLTEAGDTRALCEDMKDFSHDYIDYSNMAKQLIPEMNTVQHWSKIIETKYGWNHLEDMRKCFKDPVNSGAFDNVTHGLGLGMLDVALDMVVMVIDQQIRILSGVAASDPVDSGLPSRRIRRRQRKLRSSDNERSHKICGGMKEQGKILLKSKGRARNRKKMRTESGISEAVVSHAEQNKPDNVQSNVLTLVSVGYETVSSGMTAAGTV
uniref:Si:ch73-127m5.2 n=1 Tax=Poecilia formosa TaxID=48698 RepID=A0A087Y8L9_POEFO